MLFRSNDTATTEIYTRRNTLSLHDALPSCGTGATANVCLCERVSDKQLVVLKILKGEGSGDSDLLSRFVQEYFAASSIDSPYVAKVFEHGFTESHAYIVMEYFPAGDLRARVARDRPNVEESLIIIGSILSAQIGRAHV